MKKHLRQIFGFVIILFSVLICCFFMFYQKLPNLYAEWMTETPTLNGHEYRTYTVKKPVYDTNFVPPTTTSEKINMLLKSDLSGIRYLGTIRTMNKHLNCNIYEGISNDILNSGNAGSYPGYDLDKGNSTIAAHTYSVLGWHFYDGFTMIQLELKPNDHVYIYNGQGKYYQYQVMSKTVVPETDVQITNPNQNQDKQINPTGDPMLTMFDCYEPTNGTYLENPTNRNVVYLHLEKTYNKSNVPDNIKKLFSGLPTYEYYHDKVKVKNAPRNNWKIKFLDFLFEDLKLQNIFDLKK